MHEATGKRLRRSAAAVGVILLQGACQPTISVHGHQLDQDQLAQIRPGVTSREEVDRLLGSPSTVGTFDQESWFYVSQRREQMSFYQTQVTNQDVVRIDFDANGVVKDVSRRDLQDAQAVEPDGNKTRTMGNELTVMQQFIGNIGRFNTDPNARRPSSPGGGGG